MEYNLMKEEKQELNHAISDNKKYFFLSCPFCANRPTLYRDIESSLCFCSCSQCGMETNVFEDIESLVKFWNNRTKQPFELFLMEGVK